MGPPQLLNPTNQTLIAPIEHVDAIPLKNNTSLSRTPKVYLMREVALVVFFFIRHFCIYI
jgi:hypothetical protein